MSVNTRITLGEPHPHMAQLISNYQDGLTNPTETETVERHLLECERCREFLGSLQQVREVIGDLPGPPPSDPVQTSATYQAIRNRTQQRSIIAGAVRPKRVKKNQPEGGNFDQNKAIPETLEEERRPATPKKKSKSGGKI